MKRPLNTLLQVIALMAAMHATASAAGYTEAEFTRLHKEVTILKDSAAPREAAVGQKISAVTSVATGAESRAEMRFPDKSLTRLGANSRFTLKGEARTLDLEKGVLLLQVPEKILGAKVRTAAVTAAVTGGTVMFEYLPGGFVKLIVIEGYVDLFFNNNPSNYRTYGPGEMIIGKFDEGGNSNASLPDSVEVDLDALLKSSKLLSNNDSGAINQDLVNQAIAKQQGEIKDGKLVETNLVIPGRGTVVSLNNNTRTNLFQNFGLRDGTPPAGTVPPATTTTPSTTTQVNQQNPASQGFAPLIAGKSVLNDTSTIQTNPHVTAFNNLTGAVITSNGVRYNGNENGLMQNFAFGNTNVVSPGLQPKINAEGRWAMFRFEDLFINGSPDWITPFTFTGPESGYSVMNVILASDNGIRIGGSTQFPEDGITGAAGGYSTPPEREAVLDLWPPIVLEKDSISSLTLLSNKGDIILRGDPTGYAIYGYDQDVNIVTAGLGSDVRIEGNILLDDGGETSRAVLNVVSGQTTHIQAATVSARDVNIEAGKDVNVTGGTVEARNGNVNIKAAGQINITDSSVLRALATGGKILIKSSNGDVRIGRPDRPGDTSENISLQASDSIEIQAPNNIVLNRVTTSSDVFKATVSPNGWITIGNSNITTPESATAMIQLFGGMASGGVKFVADTTLNSPRVFVSGQTVEIVGESTRVNVPRGHLEINATNHNYKRTDGDMSKPFGTFQIGPVSPTE